MAWVQSRTALARQFGDFDSIVTVIRAAGTNSLSHFKNSYTREGGYRLQQNPDEFAGLVAHLRTRRPIRRYVEIGSASGGAGRFLSEQVGFGDFTSLDDKQHPDASMQLANFAGVPNFQQFVGDSHSAAAQRYLAQHFLARDIDVAFVDGDHSAEGVAQDVELVLPFCRPGAWLIFHDTIACEGVEKAWLGALAAGRLEPVAEFIGREAPLGIAIGAVR